MSASRPTFACLLPQGPWEPPRPRRWRALLALALTGGAWLFAGGRAQAAPPPLPLTLDQAVGRAEAESALVRRAVREREEIAAREVGAGLLLPSNPAVSFLGGTRRDPSYSPTRGPTFALRAEQTIEIGGQRGARLDVVKQAVAAARVREDVARAEVRARVRSAYLISLVAKEQVVLAQRRAELARRLVEAADTRTSAGASSDVERGLARMEQGRAARAVLEAELGAAATVASLRALLGLPAQQELQLTTALGPPPTPPADLEALLARARERRRELAALEASRGELEAELVRLNREAIPSPTVLFDTGRDLPGQTFLSAGLAVPLPIFRRYQGEKALVRAAQGRLEDEKVLLARQIEAEVAAAARTFNVRRTELSLLETEVLPAAEMSVELVTEGWRAGKFDLFRLIQVAREAAETRASRMEALASLWEASIALDRAVGGL